jgi:hypothetical protein
MAAPLTNVILLRDTGREFGPDFILNVQLPALVGATITNLSSITEVLNIVGYLSNTTRGDATTIREEGSISKLIYGEHDGVGVYTAAGLAGAPGAPGAGAALGTLYTSAPNQLIDLDTLRAPPAIMNLNAGAVAGAVIPQGILRRTQHAPLHTPTPPIDIAAVATRDSLLSDCVKQMITILENTRKIFGPKGWTALFNQVKGGGAGSKHAKRTHRQHRRKYSSKQY